jgi:hypothetical protein
MDKKRRNFLNTVATTTAVVPLSALVTSLPSIAADQPMVDADSAQAKALQYVATSEKPDQKCSTCTLFQGESGAAEGPCPLFPGNVVGAESWCSAYVPSA